MAIQVINVGNIANDGTGDDLREAFIKVNNNFQELDLRDDEQTTATNLGSSGEGVFANKVNYELQFKRLVGGDDVTLASDGQTITINANGGLKTITVNADTGTDILTETDSLTISGGTDIETSITNGTVTIEYTGLFGIESDTTPTLGGNLDANGFDINNVGLLNATQITSTFIGNLTGTVNGIDISTISQYFTDYWDMGTISPTVDSILEWVIADYAIDMGSITQPDPKTIDMGAI